jgi:hypothetical protein
MHTGKLLYRPSRLTANLIRRTDKSIQQVIRRPDKLAGRLRKRTGNLAEHLSYRTGTLVPVMIVGGTSSLQCMSTSTSSVCDAWVGETFDLPNMFGILDRATRVCPGFDGRNEANQCPMPRDQDAQSFTSPHFPQLNPARAG